MKIQYESLFLAVEKLYAKEFDENDVKGINEHCESITDLIESCGWTTEEYLYRTYNNSN
jgi:hypothetical protein